MVAEVGKLPANAVPEAGRLLARAFAADPVITHLLASSFRRRFAFPAFFRGVIREHLESGHVYSARGEQRLVGVAVWSPPEGVTRANRLLKARAYLDSLIVRVLFPQGSQHWYRGYAAIAALRPRTPHWYLAFVGIDPRCQGKGIGRLLLAPVIEAADAAGTLCYLETPFPGTHEFYRRLGFEIVTEAKAFQGAPGVWTMVRHPAIRPRPSGQM